MAKKARAIGSHHSHAPQTVEWITPPEVIAALGGPQSFDLDPCAQIGWPWDTGRRAFDTARWHYCVADDGLQATWWGRVWCNPPYTNGEIEKWLARMADHDHGTALIFARTETDAFFRSVFERASALLFLRGRLHFHYPDGTRAKANSGAPSVLCAYGATDAEILAFCGLAGQFVPLRFARSVLAAAIDLSWSEALAKWFAAQRGPVTLDDLYRAFAGTPKATANKNFRAKLRQKLQAGPYRRVARGQWELAL